MDDNGYLPDYYIRKKQRDRMYTTVWMSVLLVGIVVAGIFAGSFLWKTVGVSLRNRGKPTVNKDQANELNELQTEDRIANAMANRQGNVGDLSEDATITPVDGQTGRPVEEPDSLINAGAQSINADISDIEYSESFPLVTVALEAGDPSRKANPNSQPAEDSQSGASEDKQPSTDSTSVQTDSSNAEADKDKPAEQPKAPAESPVIGNVTYHVYAAEVGSREEAQQVVDKLAEFGYQGSIIDQKPFFLVKVTQTSKGEEARVWVQKLESAGFKPILTRKAK
ncbi:SPOR domain-containing protein [bacterium]|nr:SPOR domain-containing protein [bacterium]